MAASAYITEQDIPTYLKDVNPAPNAAVWSFFASEVSRWLDDQFGQYFYADGWDIKYFDAGDDLSSITTGGHPFYAKVGNVAACAAGSMSVVYTPYRGPLPNNGDVLTLDAAITQEQVTISGAPADNGNGTWTLSLAAPGTVFAHPAKTSATNIQVQLAYFENQPRANWTVQLSGDGVRPPSNFFCWPRNPKPAGSSADPTQRDPWFGLDIAHIPISNTTYLPTAIPGYATIAIGANWGWPAVPDQIKGLAGRITAKLWRSRGAGWSDEIGAGVTGVVHSLLREWNALDSGSLVESRFKNIYL